MYYLLPTGDNEVTLEFHQHDDAEVSLMEMRFYIPTGADSTDPQPVKVFCLFCMLFIYLLSYSY